MVLTVTLNAALDITYELEHVEWGEANRVARVHARAGGKGINVARTLQQLGREALVCGPAGGPTGDAVRADLDAAGLPHALSPLGGESRRTVAVVSRGHGHTTLLSEPGPELGADEWEALHGEVAARAARAEWAVLSGSVPPGAPEDVYGILAATCAQRGAQAAVDASGPALLAALPARPAIIKPNARELAQALGREVSGTGDALEGANELRRRGARAVVVSLGAGGACAITDEGAWHAAVPRTDGNPTGAGDALVAFLVDGALRGLPWPERLRRAAAGAAAAVAHPFAGGFDAAALPRLERGTTVRELEAR